MNWKIMFAIFVTVLLTSCGATSSISSTPFKKVDFSNIHINLTNISDSFPEKVAQLNSFDFTELSDAEDYYEFASNLNTFIEIANNELDLDVPLLKIESDSWSKISKTLNKYSPIIGSYNSVVGSAAIYTESGLLDDKKLFYILSLALVFEVGTIAFATFYSVSYKTVGHFYFKSGLNKYAVKHPVLVSKVLSWFHWTYRNILVNGSSALMAGIASYVSTNISDVDFDLVLEDMSLHFNKIKNEVSGFATKIMDGI